MGHPPQFKGHPLGHPKGHHKGHPEMSPKTKLRGTRSDLRGHPPGQFKGHSQGHHTWHPPTHATHVPPSPSMRIAHDDERNCRAARENWRTGELRTFPVPHIQMCGQGGVAAPARADSEHRVSMAESMAVTSSTGQATLSRCWLCVWRESENDVVSQGMHGPMQGLSGVARS